ncbi:MAG: hypothetical protein GX564_11005, partial [Oligosphaeraceae bacterium]|nr:hypothetical protein [Oligosphaeraceae bacterium]
MIVDLPILALFDNLSCTQQLAYIFGCFIAVQSKRRAELVQRAGTPLQSCQNIIFRGFDSRGGVTAEFSNYFCPGSKILCQFMQTLPANCLHKTFTGRTHGGIQLDFVRMQTFDQLRDSRNGFRRSI